MKQELYDYIKLYPQRWCDFYSGVKFFYPTEVPPMILVRQAFLDHLQDKEPTIDNDTGIVNYKIQHQKKTKIRY